MSYLDDVTGVYLTGQEVDNAGGMNFTVKAWGKDHFDDGEKVVLIGEVAGKERRLVVNRTRKMEILSILKGKRETALLGMTLRLTTYLAQKPRSSEKTAAISIEGLARKK